MKGRDPARPRRRPSEALQRGPLSGCAQDKRVPSKLFFLRRTALFLSPCSLMSTEKTRARFYTFSIVTLLFFLSLVAVIHIWLVDPDLYFSYYPDQAVYIVHALSFSQGEGYTTISYDPPRALTTMKPFMFSWLLSWVIRLFGLHIPVMKLMTLLIYFLGLTCYVDLVRIRGEALYGLLAAVLALSSPLSLAHSQLLLSDLTYTGFSLAALWASGRANYSRTPLRWWTAALIFCLSAFYTRTIGVSLVAAFIAAALIFPPPRLKGFHKKVFRLTVTVILVLGTAAWWGYCLSAGGWSGLNQFHEFLGSKGQALDYGNMISPFGVIARSFDNLLVYESILGQLFIPFTGSGFMHVLMGAAVLLLCITGLIRLLFKYRSAHEIYIIFYTAVLVFWDFPEMRYLLPVYTLLSYAMFCGLSAVSRLVGNRRKRLLPLGAAILILGIHLYLDLPRLDSSSPDSEGAMQRHFNVLPLNSPPWLTDFRPHPSIEINEHLGMLPLNEAARNMILLDLWIRDNVSGDALFFVNYSPEFFLVTGNRSLYVETREGRDPVELFMKHGVDYVVVAEIHPLHSRFVFEGIHLAPELFQEVARIKGTNTAVYSFMHKEG